MKEIPEELLEPVRRFQNNNYPCPLCGQQLPPYPGIHFCPTPTSGDIPIYQS